MTKYWTCLLVLASLVASPAAAQQAVPPTRHELLDSTHTVTFNAAGAYYRRETEYADSVWGVVREYTMAGQLVESRQYDNLRTRSLSGISESWWPNGQLCMHDEYAKGKRLGEMRIYYKDGKLKRRAQYAESGTSTGECFGPDGKLLPFFEYEIMPQYSQGDGGFLAIVHAIARNVKYPRDALRASAEGRVFVAFVVTSQGRVTDVKLVKGGVSIHRPSRHAGCL